MPSTTEAALEALRQVLESVPGVEVRRNEDTPPSLSRGKRVLILRDGDPGEPEVLLSPLTYSYAHVAEVEVLVQEPGARRDAVFDDLLTAVGQALAAALAADRTLGGAVEHLEVGRPADAGVVPEEGLMGVKAGTVPVTLYYDTPRPLT